MPRYDLYARLLARHFPKHFPGAPLVVVQNMPGASSLNAMNYVANVAPSDGTYFGEMQSSIAYEPMMGISGGKENSKFDPLAVHWIGSMKKEVAVTTFWNPTSIQSIDDLKTTPVKVGSSGASTANSIYARLMNSMFGTKLQVVEGYVSQVAIFLALQNGEIQGTVGPFYSALVETRPDWLRDNKVKLVVQIGLEKDPRLPEVPLLLDLAKNDADRAALKLAFQGLLMARPFVLSHKASKENVEIYRKAFLSTLADPEFIAEAKSLNFEISALDGATLQRLIEYMYATPPSIIDEVTKLFIPDRK